MSGYDPIEAVEGSADEGRARAERAERERDEARQDWANREADTMRLGVQLEDITRAMSTLHEQNSREASLRIKTEGKLAEVRTELDAARALIARAVEVIEPFETYWKENFYPQDTGCLGTAEGAFGVDDRRCLAAIAAELRKVGASV